MKPVHAFGLIVAFGATLHAQAINLHGRVSDSTGKPVANAVVELMKQGMRDTTGADGTYSIIKSSASIGPNSSMHSENLRMENGVLEFTVSQPSLVKIEVFDLKGNIQKKELLPEAQPGIYHFDVESYSHSNQMLIIRVSVGSLIQTFHYFSLQKDLPAGNFSIANTRSASRVLANLAASVDTLKVSAVGDSTKKIGLTSYDTTVNVTMVADATSVYHPCPTDGSPCKILPFGDSITRGAKSTDDGGYRSQLFKLVVAAKQNVTFVGSLANGPTTVSGVTFPRSHEGHVGWTISQLLPLVPSPALNGKPNIILLHIGTNDIGSRDPAMMAKHLDSLIEKTAQNAPTALIVVAQITAALTDNDIRDAYNAKIPGIIQSHAAKRQHIIGVDMNKIPVADLSPDGVHPNDKGYVYMAGIWYAAIKDLLP